MRSKQSVALSEANAHHQFLHEDLARSGLTPKDIDVEPLPATSRDVGYTIKYPGHDGMWRRRFKNKEPKYTQPKDQHGVWVRSMEAYDEWQHAPYRLIVEGEKKAAAAIKHLGLPAVGIGTFRHLILPGVSLSAFAMATITRQARVIDGIIKRFGKGISIAGGQQQRGGKGERKAGDDPAVGTRCGHRLNLHRRRV